MGVVWAAAAGGVDEAGNAALRTGRDKAPACLPLVCRARMPNSSPTSAPLPLQLNDMMAMALGGRAAEQVRPPRRGPLQATSPSLARPPCHACASTEPPRAVPC